MAEEKTIEGMAQKAVRYKEEEPTSTEQTESNQDGQTEEANDNPINQTPEEQTQEADAQQESSEQQGEGESEEEQQQSEASGGQGEYTQAIFSQLSEESPEDANQSEKKTEPKVDAETQKQLEQYGVKDPADPQQLLQALQQQAEQAKQQDVPEELQNDPVYQDFVNWRKNGGQNISEFAQRYSIPNPQEVEPREAYRKTLELDNYSEEAVEEALDQFDSESGFDREKKEKEAINRLTDFYQKQEEARKQGPQGGDNNEQLQELAQKLQQNMQAKAQQIVNKKVPKAEFQITQDVADNVLKNAGENEVVVFRNGEPSAQDTIEHNFNKQYLDQLLENARKRGRNEAQAENFNDKTVPSQNERPKRSQYSDKEMSKVDQAREAARNAVPGKK